MWVILYLMKKRGFLNIFVHFHCGMRQGVSESMRVVSPGRGKEDVPVSCAALAHWSWIFTFLSIAIRCSHKFQQDRALSSEKFPKWARSSSIMKILKICCTENDIIVFNFAVEIQWPSTEQQNLIHMESETTCNQISTSPYHACQH